jgi:hypothetical protein
MQNTKINWKNYSADLGTPTNKKLFWGLTLVTFIQVLEGC